MTHFMDNKVTIFGAITNISAVPEALQPAPIMGPVFIGVMAVTRAP